VKFLLLIDLIDDDEKVAFLRNIPNSRLECKNHTLLLTKMTKMNTLFMTKAAENIPFGSAHTFLVHTRDTPTSFPGSFPWPQAKEKTLGTRLGMPLGEISDLIIL